MQGRYQRPVSRLGRTSRDGHCCHLTWPSTGSYRQWKNSFTSLRLEAAVLSDEPCSERSVSLVVPVWTASWWHNRLESAVLRDVMQETTCICVFLVVRNFTGLLRLSSCNSASWNLTLSERLYYLCNEQGRKWWRGVTLRHVTEQHQDSTCYVPNAVYCVMETAICWVVKPYSGDLAVNVKRRT